MAKDMHAINLLPNKGGGLIAQFLEWALNIGRLLIILTEILALGTFIYRFSLDMKIVDLHDHIKAQSFIVKNFSNNETTYRNLQSRLLITKQYDSIGTRTPNLFKDIIEMGRGHLTFKSILIGADSAKIEAQAPSSAALTAFVNSLKKHDLIQGVSIEKVENKTSSALITIGVTATLKPSGITPPGEAQTGQQPLQQPAQQPLAQPTGI